MSNIQICHCPYTSWCEEGRQKLQDSFRKEDEDYKVDNCVFYKYIKRNEEQPVK